MKYMFILLLLSVGMTSMAMAEKPQVIGKPTTGPQLIPVTAAAQALAKSAVENSTKRVVPDQKRTAPLELPKSGGNTSAVSRESSVNTVVSELIMRKEQRGPRDSTLDQGADNCPTTVITYTDFFDIGTTVGQANNHTPSCSYSNAPDVVYVYMPPVSGWTTVSLCGYQLTFDTILEIYEGPCPGTSWLACNDDSPECGLQSQLEVYMYAGTQYTIWVDGYSANEGTYWISIEGPRPPGERGEYAIPLSVPGVATGNTCIYKDDYGFNCAGQDSAGDVVYEVIPSQNMSVTFSLCHSSYDTKLYIADGDSSFSTIVACNDDAATCPCADGPYRSLLECVPLLAGHHYLVAVDGYSSNCGEYVLTANECMACDVTSASGDVLEITEDCSDSNFHANDPNGGWNSTPQQFSAIANDQWVFGRVFTYLHSGSPARDTDHYLFTVAERETLRLDLWGAEFPLQVMIWDTATGEHVLDQDFLGCTFLNWVQPGACIEPGTYVLFVAPDDFVGAPLPVDYRIKLRWNACGPVNDHCVQAAPITVNSPTPTFGTTLGATTECAPYPEVWYTFTLPQSSDVELQFCGSDFEGGLISNVVYSGPCCTGTEYVAPYWEYATCPDGDVTAHHTLPAGQYWFAVSLSIPANFYLRVTAGTSPPSNDHCETARSLYPGLMTGGSTLWATVDVAPDCNEPLSAPGVWFKLLGTGNMVSVSTCGTSAPWDTRLSVFTCGCDNLNCIAANDDDATCYSNPLASNVTWCTRAGEEYLILVHGYGGASGGFRIEALDTGSGCSPAAACLDHVLTAPGQVTGTTTGLRNDCALEPTEDAQIKVVIPHAGWWLFSLCGSEFDTRMYIDTMRCGGGVYSNDDRCGLQSQFCLSLVPDEFYVTVEGNNASGDYVFSVTESGQPAQVLGVQASDTSCTGVRVTWQNSSEDQFGYTIRRDGQQVGFNEPDVTEFLDNPPDNDWHSYTIQVINNCLTSAASLPDSGRKLAPITMAVTLLSPPNGAEVLSGELIEYCCSALSEATFYYFLWDDDPAFTSPYGHGESDPCVSNSFYIPLGTWYWKGRAENACGPGPWSAVGTFHLGELVAPQLTIVVEGTQLRLTWTANPFATSYEVQSSTTSEGGYSFLASTTATSITTSFSADEKRFYRVIAHRATAVSGGEAESESENAE